MVQHAADEYGSMGSVPTAQPTGLNAPQLGVHANPEEFGAQIGAGVQKVGAAGEEVANQWNGLIAETQANQSELAYLKGQGDLKAKYSKYEGLQAEAMRPQFEAESQALHDQFRSGLSPIASKMFDSNTTRALGYNLSEYAGYAASQVKNANLKSQDSLMDMAVAHTGDLSTVLDARRFGDQVIAPIIHGGNAIADIHGDSIVATGTDANTGNYSYPNTPEGKAAEARHLAVTNTALSKAYLTAAKTIADNQGATASADWLQAHWNQMPDAAKVAANQYIAPKMKNEAIAGNINNETNRLDDEYSKQYVSNVPASPTSQPLQTPLDVIRKNEGYTGKVGKDSNGYEVLNGINGQFFPKELAEAKDLLATRGKSAADSYADNFYQKNILDRYNIASLPVNTQSIVADGLVNHGTGAFGQSLIAAAKGGASPQELIDMRRTEYQRLADSDTDGKKGYAASLKGWNARLDGFQTQQGNVASGVPYSNKKDFLEANKEEYVNNTVSNYLKKYGDDYYGAQIQEKRATAEINKKIAIETGKMKSDTDIVEKAISGSMTKGQSPTTIQDLQAIPGIAPVLDRIQREQGDFYKTIDTRLAKASHGDLSVNSPNAYDAALNSLDRSTDITRQGRITYLSKGLGSDNPGISISQKDFNDFKPGVDFSDDVAKVIREEMINVAGANGNTDGKGQQRAVQWAITAMDMVKKNDALGDKKLSDTDLSARIKETVDGHKPSLTEQLTNLVKGKQTLPTIASPNDPAFQQLQSGAQFQTADGQIRTKK